MLEKLKELVLKANLDLVKNGLVLYTWGNVSVIDRKSGLIVIKPSGVEYDKMTADDMVVVDLDGNKVEGDLNPSSDTPTHIELYKAHKNIGGVAHTHSTFATGFSQSCKSIPMLGTTHADYFHGDIPCGRDLKKEEMAEYEKNTGKVLNETIKDIEGIPACLAAHHGVFAFGKTPGEAVYNATVAEYVAKLAFITIGINSGDILSLRADNKRLPDYIADKHYDRKHGKNAYYGQKNRDL